MQINVIWRQNLKLVVLLLSYVDADASGMGKRTNIIYVKRIIKFYLVQKPFPTIKCGQAKKNCLFIYFMEIFCINDGV
jgi:hypothetical protein